MKLYLSGKSNHLFTEVSLEDYSYLSQFKWYVGMTGYPERHAHYYVGSKRKSKSIFLHREVLARAIERQLIKGELCDHIDRTKLNNQRTNLRLATKSLNSANRGLSISNTTGYRGVTWRQDRQRWQAQIRVDGKQKQLGRFTELRDAVLAYNTAATRYYGEYAGLNEWSA